MRKVSVILGTRPEAIKLSPVILALREHSEFESHVCVTGQHNEMLYQILDIFGIAPDIDLELMEENQTLADFTSRAIIALDGYFIKYKPDIVIVQGDTTTVFAASLVAFYSKIPIGHVEAGLRTHDKYSPYPEEINRVLTTHIAEYHFAPTELSKLNLLKERVPPEHIFITGNTVIDALYIAISKIRQQQFNIPGLPIGHLWIKNVNGQ
ncbi:MAG: non-hydrolyzing UDP-N-acetylglucosamine 2-epimerase [bacterium]